MQPSVYIASDREKLADHAVAHIIENLNLQLSAAPSALIAVSGGRTPSAIFARLGHCFKTAVDWSRVHVLWVDERCVPADHEDSNFGQANRLWLRHIPSVHIWRMPGEWAPSEGALFYEDMLRRLLEGDGNALGLVLLGMGDDGHTASLFPDSDGLREEQSWVVEQVVPGKDHSRLTLTLPALSRALCTYCIVSGEKKQAVLKQVFTHKGREGRATYPIEEAVRVSSSFHWMLDAAAAGPLKGLDCHD